MHNNHPELLRDQYWDEVFPTELPHTVASEMYREEPPCHSTANIHVSKDDGEIISPPSVKSIFHMSESGVSVFSFACMPHFNLDTSTNLATSVKIIRIPHKRPRIKDLEGKGDRVPPHNHQIPWGHQDMMFWYRICNSRRCVIAVVIMITLENSMTIGRSHDGKLWATHDLRDIWGYFCEFETVYSKRYICCIIHMVKHAICLWKPSYTYQNLKYLWLSNVQNEIFLWFLWLANIRHTIPFWYCTGVSFPQQMPRYKATCVLQNFIVAKTFSVTVIKIWK